VADAVGDEDHDARVVPPAQVAGNHAGK